jgi:ankyrin repeat protein
MPDVSLLSPSKTVLKGQTPKTKDQFFGDNGNGGKNPRVNPQALDLWLSKLSSAGDADNQPIAWIQQMLELGPKNRISSVQLLDSVLGYADQHIYYGHCCADQDEDASSCKSSEFADSDSDDARAEEETNATSVLSDPGRDVKARLEVLSPLPLEGSSTGPSDLGVALRSSSTNPLSDKSISPAVTSRGTSNLSPESYPVQNSPYEERKENSLPQVELPVLQSKNPFRPGYVPSIYPISSRAAESDPALPPVFGFSDDAQTTVNSSGLISHDTEYNREEIITVHDSRWSAEMGENADQNRLEPANEEIPTSPETSQPLSQHQQSSLGSNSSLDHLSLLFEAAASGDVHKLLRYSSAGNSNYIQEGALGKSIFHAAAVNDQISVMQLLLDMGCPIFPNDITTYILPAVDNGRLNVDSHYIADELPLRSIENEQRSLSKSATEVNNTSTSQPPAVLLPVQHSHTEAAGTYGSQVQPVDRPPGLGIPEWYDALHGLGVIRLALGRNSIEITRNDFANIRPSYSIGPWTPAGYHWGLTIHPDPEALHKALRSSDYDHIVDCLGDEGCDPNMRDAEGRYPLDIAIEHKNTLFIQTLIVYGADPGPRDSPELRQVLSQMNGHGAEPRTGTNALHHRVQIPRTVQAPWQGFVASVLSGKGFPESKPRLEVTFVVNGGADWLERWQVAVPSRFYWLLNTSGKLVWHEEPERFVDAYPGQCFELDSTSKNPTTSKRSWLKNAIRGF